MSATPGPPPALLGKFHVEDKGGEWHLRCVKCGEAWALRKSSKHPGNVLHLLNHAASHDPDAERGL